MTNRVAEAGKTSRTRRQTVGVWSQRFSSPPYLRNLRPSIYDDLEFDLLGRVHRVLWLRIRINHIFGISHPDLPGRYRFFWVPMVMKGRLYPNIFTVERFLSERRSIFCTPFMSDTHQIRSKCRSNIATYRSTVCWIFDIVYSFWMMTQFVLKLGPLKISNSKIRQHVSFCLSLLTLWNAQGHST